MSLGFFLNVGVDMFSLLDFSVSQCKLYSKFEYRFYPF